MVDVNGSWDVDTAIQQLKAWEPYDVYWLEEPLPPHDIQGYALVMCLAVYTLTKKPRGRDTDSRSGRCVVEAKISADHIPLDCRKGIEIER